MKNVITYSRSATEDKIIDTRTGEYVDPLQYQNELIMEYCNNYNYNIIEHFEEIYGCSKLNRLEWKKIRKLIKKKYKSESHIDAIVILRPDRFSRNLMWSFKEANKLSNIGCELEFVEGLKDDYQITLNTLLNKLNII